MAKAAAKKGKKGEPEQQNAVAAWTQRARGIGLLLGFGVAFWVSRGEGLPTPDCVLRGVVGGLAMSLVTWWCALMVIQALMRTAVTRQRAEALVAQSMAEQEAAAAHAELAARGR